jgi:peroxiredoxin Q/BCP
MAKGPSIGDRAPDFALPGDDGKNIALKDYRGKIVVLYFYPKDDTSGCTKEAIGFSESGRAFAKLGAIVIGCSKDSVASHDKFKKKHGLAIRLAADTELKTANAYGVWVEKSLYGRKYMGMDRATFLIDGEGVLRQIWRKVKVPGHVESVLSAVKTLTSGS